MRTKLALQIQNRILSWELSGEKASELKLKGWGQFSISITIFDFFDFFEIGPASPDPIFDVLALFGIFKTKFKVWEKLILFELNLEN